MTPGKLIDSIDWLLLREQKNYCLNEAANRPDTADIYDGITALIDNLQDCAVANGFASVETVFGEPL